MEYLHLDFSFLTNIEEKYPGGNPVASKTFYLNSINAYTIYQRGNWTKEEFHFLKEVVHYHLSAPCYEKKFDKEAKSALSVQPTINLMYIVVKLLMQGITIF